MHAHGEESVRDGVIGERALSSDHTITSSRRLCSHVNSYIGNNISNVFNPSPNVMSHCPSWMRTRKDRSLKIASKQRATGHIRVLLLNCLHCSLDHFMICMCDIETCILVTRRVLCSPGDDKMHLLSSWTMQCL